MQRSTATANIYEAGVEVYSAYSLLDLLSNPYYLSKGKDFEINGAKISLRDYFSDLIKNQQTTATFTLGTQVCQVKLTQLANQEWQVELQGLDEEKENEEKEAGDLKPIHLYKPKDLLKFCRKYPLSLTQDAAGAYKFSAELAYKGKKLRLGGANKIDLYQLHLSNLFTMLARLKGQEVTPDMLVAMATGSGKTFTQAIWFLMLFLTDNPCFFAVPSESLVIQLKRDFARLLPDELAQVLMNFAPGKLTATPEGPKWGLMSHKTLLQDHWDFLQSEVIRTSTMHLCLDEEHLAGKEELLSKRLKILAENYPIMYLTATPTAEVYERTGDQPVASLSLKQKRELGISKAIHSHQARAREGAIKKGRKASPLSFLNGLIMRFVNAIETERLSTAHEYADQSETVINFREPTDPFYAKPNHNEVRRFMRWNMPASLGEKALLLVARHDPIVNFNLLSQGISENPYKNGNRVFRDKAYEFFQLGGNLDETCIKNHQKAKKAWQREQYMLHLKANFTGANAVSEERLFDEIDANLDFDDTSKYTEYRVLHGLIDNTLTYLLGYDSNQLNYHRFHNFEQLAQEVRAKLQKLPRNFFGQLNAAAVKKDLIQSLAADKLPPPIMQELADAMSEVLIKLEESQPEQRERLIDNWNLDKNLHQLFMPQQQQSYLYSYDSFPVRENKVKSFVTKHKTIFLVNGLESSASSIESNHPFFNLEEHRYDKDAETVTDNTALSHKLSPIEALDDTTKQVVYTPNYCPDEYSPTVVDTLFRKGLIGAYITSEKAAGFNDPNLHHVGMLVDDYDDPMNSPETIIQGFGRNRGLDPACEPSFFLVSQADTEISFSPENMDKTNYYPPFFEAKKRHNKKLTKKLGERIAAQMRVHIERNLYPTGEFKVEELQNNLHDLVISEFEKIYSNNRFDFKKSKELFSGVLEDTYKALYVEAAKLKKMYSLTFAPKVIAAILNFICKIYYNLKIAVSYFSFVSASRKLVEKSGNEAVYARIVRTNNFKDLIALFIPATRFAQVLRADAAKTVKLLLEERLVQYLKPEVKAELTSFFINELSSYFVRYLGTREQQLELLRLIAKNEGWLEKTDENTDALLSFDDAAVAKYIGLIRTVPEIRQYIDDQKLQIDLRRPKVLVREAARLRVVMGAIIQNKPKLEAADLAKLTAKISQNLGAIQFLFVPKDAAFLLANKDKIAITEEALSAFMREAEEEKGEELDLEGYARKVIKLLRSSLPAEVLQQAAAGSCLRVEDYQMRQKLTAFKDKLADPKKLFDLGAMSDSMAQVLDRYLKSPIIKKLVNTALDPFSLDQLVTLLNALYPQDKAPKLKQVLLIALAPEEKLAEDLKQTAEANNTPVLIERNRKYFLYRHSLPGWGETELNLTPAEASVLQFQKNVAIKKSLEDEAALRVLLEKHHLPSNMNIRKAQTLRGFRRDLKTLSTREIFRKYISFEDLDIDNIEANGLSRIFSYLTTLCDEILRCECYWHHMSAKGNSTDPTKPRLLSDAESRVQPDHPNHPIWKMHGTTDTWSILTTISKKTLFLKGTQKSFDPLNKVDALKNMPLIGALQQAATFFVKPLKKALNNPQSTASKKGSLAQLSLFKSAQHLGKSLGTAQALTAAEVRASGTRVLNAVQRLQRKNERLLPHQF